MRVSPHSNDQREQGRRLLSIKFLNTNKNILCSESLTIEKPPLILQVVPAPLWEISGSPVVHACFSIMTFKSAQFRLRLNF
jgi:hypothetical protein